MSFSALSDAERDRDGASHRFLKRKRAGSQIACEMQILILGRLSADCVVVGKKK